MAEIKNMTYLDDIKAVTKIDLPWSKLNGCSVLVTGATGLIGGCLVETLINVPNRGFQVYASGRNEDRFREKFSKYLIEGNVHFIKHDITDPFKEEYHFDFIIHSASNASPNFFVKKPVEIMKSNIYGVCNLIEYGLRNGMKRFLFVSSGEVYGEGDGRVFTEDYSGYVNCATPRACYPSSKRAAETLCMSYIDEYGADIVIVRPCHVYGPHFTDSDNRVYAQFIRNAISGNDIVLKSSGSQYRSWCYVVDCVSAILFCLLKGDCGGVYNIADPMSNVSIRDLAELVASIVGKKVRFEKAEDKEAKGYNVVSQSIFSIDRICELGWSPRTSIEDGVLKTIREVTRV